MLDADLAVVFGVSTKRLNQQVKRNWNRFPEDFAFLLTPEEVANLRSQIATSSSALRHGGRRYLPHAFTEHGAVMLATVLNSPVAVQASIQVVRAFVSLRALASSHAELARKIDQLERKYDRQFKVVFDAIRELMRPLTPEERKQIGFRATSGGMPVT
ncbi:MAG: ORF6N domain-containing protein [Gemmatimonadetes bacterium]|nr:ORF6N domain-containing protein [Gemmatimonadota bacterium]